MSFFPLVTATLLKSYPIRYLVLTAACARRVRRIQAGMVIVRICSRPLHARRMDGHQSKLQSNLFASIQTIEPGLYVPPLPHFPKGFHNQVVRIEDDGTSHAGAPATQQQQKAANEPNAGLVMLKKRGALTMVERADEAFSINVVSVRTQSTKTRMRTTKKHEEFIVRTRRKGEADIYVARRYGEFVRLAETVRFWSLSKSRQSAY